MKILLAVDGSKYSLDAVDSLVEHADWFRESPAVEPSSALAADRPRVPM